MVLCRSGRNRDIPCSLQNQGKEDVAITHSLKLSSRMACAGIEALKL